MEREHRSPIVRVSTAVWRQSEPEALELATIDQTSIGFRLSGDVAVGNNNNSMTFTYHIDVDADWRTESVVASVRHGAGAVRQIALIVTAAHEWSVRRGGGEPWVRAPEFDGLIDIDLGCTPATNILPIKRFALEIGESAAMTAVWITFPDLSIETLPQRYTRLSDREYHYESFLTSFEADLHVDDFGVVDRYADLWQRLNAAS